MILLQTHMPRVCLRAIKKPVITYSECLNTQPYSYCVQRMGHTAISSVAEWMVMKVARAQEHPIHGGEIGASGARTEH